MVYQKEAELVELSVPGAKSSGARSVPYSCRPTVTLKVELEWLKKFAKSINWGAEWDKKRESAVLNLC